MLWDMLQWAPSYTNNIYRRRLAKIHGFRVKRPLQSHFSPACGGPTNLQSDCRNSNIFFEHYFENLKQFSINGVEYDEKWHPKIEKEIRLHDIKTDKLSFTKHTIRFM